MRRHTLAVALMILMAGSAQAASISTVFNGIQYGVNLNPPFIDDESLVLTEVPDAEVSFTLGMDPFTATFAGDGFPFHSNNSSLYRPGSFNAWGVWGPGVGVIDFGGLPASEFSIYARGSNDGQSSSLFGDLGNAAGYIRSFTPEGDLIDMTPFGNNGFSLIRHEGQIGRIELVNQTGADSNSFAVIGEFQATAVPEPSSAVISLSALGVMLGGLGLRSATRRKR